MKRGLLLSVVLVLVAVMVVGCGSKVSEDKPIAEIKQEARTLNVSQLQGVVDKYKKAIEAKKPELQKLQAQLKEIPITQMFGEDAAAIKEEITKVTTSIKALTDRMNVYLSALNKKK